MRQPGRSSLDGVILRSLVETIGWIKRMACCRGTQRAGREPGKRARDFRAGEQGAQSRFALLTTAAWAGGLRSPPLLASAVSGTRQDNQEAAVSAAHLADASRQDDGPDAGQRQPEVQRATKRPRTSLETCLPIGGAGASRGKYGVCQGIQKSVTTYPSPDCSVHNASGRSLLQCCGFCIWRYPSRE